MRWIGHAERMGEKRNECRVLMGKQEERNQIRGSRRKLVDNIKMDLRYKGCSSET
jgi:hypothetical protein